MDHPTSFDVTSTLREFLEAHSVKVSAEDQALVAGNMRASARVFRKQSAAKELRMVQLDINVNSPFLGERTLTESFAGWDGNEEEAVKQAWEKFARSSLHVLLEIFVGHQREREQIEWEEWKHGEKTWQACMGPLFLMGFGTQQHGPNIVCGGLLDQLRDSLLPSLGPGYHWLRFYYMRNGNTAVGSECLLDNDPWIDGQNRVNQWSWPDGSYSVRLFLILSPDRQA